MFSKRFQPDTIQKLTELIVQQTGIYIRDRDWKYLEKKLRDRLKTLSISSPESYYQLLTTPGEASQREWQTLALLITNNESYLFRDKGQFTLLRERIFPQMIQQKRQSGKLSLRIWSAGCSTGEEPYSLAILLQELISDWHRWHIEIIGTDLNSNALQKAREACFNAWSFRLVPSEIQENYFHKLGYDRWQLNALSRSWVKFTQGNLLKDPFPNNLIYDLDLIVCRNVFVYFRPHAIGIVLKKFHASLRPGGYLLTGHAETQGQDLHQFQTKVFRESIIFQRPESPVPMLPLVPKVVHPAVYPSPPPPQPRLVSPPPPKPAPKANHAERLLSKAKQYFDQKQYNQAIQTAQELVKVHPRHFQGLYLLAQLYGNVGQYAQAKEYCQRAIQVDSLAVDPYYLLAKVAEEEQDLDQARNLLKKVIYLDPEMVLAYLELSDLYALEGDQEKSQKMLQSALAELGELPPQQPIKGEETSTVQDLMDQVKGLLTNQ